MITWSKFRENMDRKVMILMRGVSGSGKSTRAQQLAKSGGAVFSTDDFFGADYNFDPEKVPEAHQWNQDRVREAMGKGVSPVIVDNTNVEAWEMKPYVLLAQQNGYEVQFGEPETDVWQQAKEANALLRNVADQLAKLNSHGISSERIAQMISMYAPADVPKILASKMPWENPPDVG